MARVEIDEVELRRHHQLAQTVNTIMKNPRAKLLVQQAHKLVDPNAQTPELNQLQIVNTPIVAMQKKIDDFMAASAKEKAERQKNETLGALSRQRDDGFARLRSAGWTEEGLKGVEETMQSKGLLDPMDAAAIFEKAHPPQTPGTPAGTGAWNFAEGVSDEQVDLKKLLETKGQNDLVVDKMAHTVLNEVRQASRR